MKGVGMAVVVVVVAAAAMALVEGRGEDSSCIKKLIPCLNYLNGTGEPPESCCGPLISVIETNPRCLCSLISTKGSDQAERAGININDAQQLPARCGQHVNPLACLTPPGSYNDAAVSAMSSSLQLVTMVVLVIMSAVFRFL